MASTGTLCVPVSPLLALLVTIVVELFNHKSFTEGLTGFWNFLSRIPWRCLSMY